MKYCKEYAALLDAFADGELGETEAARVREHLVTCAGCRAYLDGVLAVRRAFPTAEDAEIPDGFADGVMAAIRAQAAPQHRKRAPWRKVVVPLAACLAIFVAIGGFRHALYTGGASASIADNASPAESGTDGSQYGILSDASGSAEPDSSAAGSERMFSALSSGTAKAGAEEKASGTSPSQETKDISGSAAEPPAENDTQGETESPAGTGSEEDAESPQMNALTIAPTVGGGTSPAAPEERYRKVLYVDTADVGSLLDGEQGVASQDADGNPETRYEMSEEEFDALAKEWSGVPVQENQDSETDLCCVIVTGMD